MEETSTAVKQDPPQSGEKFMRQVRRQNRKKFTAEEKIRVVLEGMKREIPVSELCRREGIPTAARRPPTYWTVLGTRVGTTYGLTHPDHSR